MMIRPRSPGATAGRSAALSKDLLLGTVRAARPGNLRHLLGAGGGDMMQGTSGEGPLSDSGDGTIQPLDRLYPRFLQIKPQDGGRTLLLLANDESSAQYHVLIDTVRSVVLSVEEWDRGTLVSTVTRGDFVQVAGAWLAGRIEKTDAKGRRLSLVTRKFTALGPGEMDRQWKRGIGRSRPGPTPPHAPAQSRRRPPRRCRRPGNRRGRDRAARPISRRESNGTACWQHLEKAEKLSGKPGMRWVRYNILQLCSDDERLKKCFCDEATRLAREGGDQAYLADSILGPASGVLEPDEALSLCDVLRPFFQRLPACRHGMKTWTQRRIECLVRADRGLEALRLRRQLAGEYPRDVQVQCDYVSALVERGQTEAVAAWLGRVLVPEAGWEPEDEESLRSIFTAVLRLPAPRRGVVGLPGGLDRAKSGGAEAVPRLLGPAGANRPRRTGRDPDRPLACGGTAAGGGVAAGRCRPAPGRGVGGAGGKRGPECSHPLARGPLVPTADRDGAGPCPLPAGRLFQFRARIGCADRRRHREWVERQFVDPSARRRVLPPGRDGRPQASGPVGEALAAGGLAVGTMDPVRGFAARRGAVEEDRRCAAAPLGCRPRRRRQARRWGGPWKSRSPAAMPAPRSPFCARSFGPRRAARNRNTGSRSSTALLGAPWSEASESEALSLLDKIALSDEPAENLVCQIEALYRITDSMVRARLAARTKAAGHPAKLVRGPRQAGRREDLRLARQGLADSLRRAADRAGPALAPWMRVEAIDLDVLAQQKPDQVAEECWKQARPANRRSPRRGPPWASSAAGSDDLATADRRYPPRTLFDRA